MTRQEERNILAIVAKLLQQCTNNNEAHNLGHGLHSMNASAHDPAYAKYDGKQSVAEIERFAQDQTARVAALQQEILLKNKQLQQEKDSLEALLAAFQDLKAKNEHLESLNPQSEKTKEISASANPSGLVDGRHLTLVRSQASTMRLTLSKLLDDFGTQTVSMSDRLKNNLTACASGAKIYNENADDQMMLSSLMCNELVYAMRGFVNVISQYLPKATIEVLGKTNAHQAKTFIVSWPDYQCCVYCTKHFNIGHQPVRLTGDPQTAFIACRGCFANAFQHESTVYALDNLRQSFPIGEPNLELMPEHYHRCSYPNKVRWDLLTRAAGFEKYQQQVFVQDYPWLLEWYKRQLDGESAEEEGQQDPPSPNPDQSASAGGLHVGSDNSDSENNEMPSESPPAGMPYLDLTLQEDAPTSDMSRTSDMAFQHFASM